MNKLFEIQKQILETNGALAELEREIVKEPKSESLAAMAKSLEKRYIELEEAFSEEAESLGVDICAYRLLPEEEERPTLRALSSVLGDFQNLVTTVYDAIKTAIPKTRARISKEIETETEFRFGYTYPGSVGVVLTMPSERLLFGESYLDESVRLISEMARLHDSPSVLEFARKLGPASVRALYRWAYDHDESGSGVEIEWRRRKEIRTRLFAQRPELSRLHNTIGITSDEIVSEQTVHADLVGADILRQTFHMKLDTGEEIRGSMSEEIEISEEKTLELPRRYRAKIVKTEKILYSTEQEIVSYYLKELEPLD